MIKSKQCKIINPRYAEIFIVRSMTDSKRFLQRTKRLFGLELECYCSSWNIQDQILPHDERTIKGKWLCQPCSLFGLLWVIRYIPDTKNLGLKLEPVDDASEPLEIIFFSNSDYVGDPVSKKSVSGFILCVLGVLVSWQQKAQQTMTLSSSEAEWATLLVAVNEVLSLIKLLRSMKILVSSSHNNSG